MDSTESIIKGKAEKYAGSKTLICPFEAYEGYLAGYNECLKDQAKINLQKSIEIKAEADSKLEPYVMKIDTLTKELKKEKEKHGNNGNGNSGGNNGNGNGHGNH